jgi:hypothetical protein
MAEEFNLTVKLRHEFGGWYRYVGQHSGRESITAEQALEWAALAGDGVVEEVKAIIRSDADEAEESAERAHERSTAEAARLAQDAVNAHRMALVRREEATKLAPQPEPARSASIVDDPLGPGPGKERAEC